MEKTLLFLHQNAQNPLGTRFVARTCVCSHEGNKWGLGLDTRRTSQPQEIQLHVTYYRRKGARLEVKIDLPFPQPPPKKQPANPIQQAIRVKDYLSRNLEQNFLSSSNKLNIHRKRISKLIHIIDRLPPDFIEKFKDCADPKILHYLTVKRLLKITSNADLNEISKLLKLFSDKINDPKIKTGNSEKLPEKFIESKISKRY